jgi:hypothetical protein
MPPHNATRNNRVSNKSTHSLTLSNNWHYRQLHHRQATTEVRQSMSSQWLAVATIAKWQQRTQQTPWSIVEQLHTYAHYGNLRTVTNKTIQLYGVRWVHMQSREQPTVIPFYVRDIHDPILSATRRTEQGFDIKFNDNPTMSHNKGFNVPLVQQHNLYYLQASLSNQ